MLGLVVVAVLAVLAAMVATAITTLTILGILVTAATVAPLGVAVAWTAIVTLSSLGVRGVAVVVLVHVIPLGLRHALRELAPIPEAGAHNRTLMSLAAAGAAVPALVAIITKQVVEAGAVVVSTHPVAAVREIPEATPTLQHIIASQLLRAVHTLSAWLAGVKLLLVGMHNDRS